MLFGIILAAAASTAAASVRPLAQIFPVTLPLAARGLHCPSGGHAIGDPVGKTYILQELEIDSRAKDSKLVGFIYSGADGIDYIDLSPSAPHEKTRVMRTGDIDETAMMMRYCFSAPWDGTRTASR